MADSDARSLHAFEAAANDGNVVNDFRGAISPHSSDSGRDIRLPEGLREEAMHYFGRGEASTSIPTPTATPTNPPVGTRVDIDPASL